MALRIEDYALIGDCRTGALVGSDGSIDWLCLPRFDSASMFGALLGTEDHGRWQLAPSAQARESTRAYVDGTFTLVTRWVTPTGVAEVVDLMPVGDGYANIIRRVRGISGTVEFTEDLVIRFDYGEAIPWVRQIDEEGTRAIVAIAGPDGIVRRGPPLDAVDYRHRGRICVSDGKTVDLTMTWFPSHLPVPARRSASEHIASTTEWWLRWSASATA